MTPAADTHPLSRAILAATDRPRRAWRYDPARPGTPLEQHDAAVAALLADALAQSEARARIAEWIGNKAK